MAGLFLLTMVKLNLDKMYMLYILMLISIPRSISFLFLKVPVLKVTVTEGFLLFIILALIICIFFREINFVDIFQNKSYLLMMMVFAGYTVLGYSNHNIYILDDARTFFMFIIYLLTSLLLKTEKMSFSCW